MAAAKTVTVTLPTGARVTCSEETAQKLGLKEQPKKAPAKRAASTKSED